MLETLDHNSKEDLKDQIDSVIPPMNKLMDKFFIVCARKKGQSKETNAVPLSQLEEKVFYWLLKTKEVASEKMSYKTGAHLLFRKDGIVINIYDREAIDPKDCISLWKNLVEGTVDLENFLTNSQQKEPKTLHIPVAPISKAKDRLRVQETTNRIRVLSRFCGLSETMVISVITNAMKKVK